MPWKVERCECGKGGEQFHRELIDQLRHSRYPPLSYLLFFFRFQAAAKKAAAEKAAAEKAAAEKAAAEKAA